MIKYNDLQSSFSSTNFRRKKCKNLSYGCYVFVFPVNDLIEIVAATSRSLFGKYT
jgi:hypothetical protein